MLVTAGLLTDLETDVFLLTRDSVSWEVTEDDLQLGYNVGPSTGESNMLLLLPVRGQNNRLNLIRQNFT